MCIYETWYMIDPVLVPDEDLKGGDHHILLQNRKSEKAIMTSTNTNPSERQLVFVIVILQH